MAKNRATELESKPGMFRDLDAIVSKNVLGQLRRDPPRTHGEAAPRSNVDNGDLVASMAARLASAEKALKERNAAFAKLQAEHEALKSKLAVAEHEIAASRPVGSSGDAGTAAAEVAHLKAENVRLRSQKRLAWQQVAELKSFLSDYGMVWVGSQEPNDSALSPKGSAAAAAAAANSKAGEQQRPLSAGHIVPAPTAEHSANSSAAAAKPRSSYSGNSNLPPLRSSSAKTAEWGKGAPLSSPPAGAAAAAGGGGGFPPPAAHAPPAGGAVKPPTQPPQHPVFKRQTSGNFGGAVGHGDGHAAAGSSSSSSGAVPPAAPGGKGSSAALASSSSAAAASSSSAAAANGGRGGAASTSAPSAAGGGAPAGRFGAPSAAGPPFNIADLKARVIELNELAEGGTDAVELLVYRDGLKFHTMPARPYTHPTVKAILSDILDGYFPAQLKNTFPDGVPIMVIDNSQQAMDAVAAQGNIHSFADIGNGLHDVGPQSREKFLSKLPQSVIRNGKIIDVRGGVAQILAGGSGPTIEKPPDSVAVVSTSADKLLSTLQRNHVGPSLPPSAPSRSGAAEPEITTLRVKSEDGQQTYIIKLQYDETIGALRKYIDEHRAKGSAAAGGGGHPAAAKHAPAASVPYEIRTSFPNRAYADTHETLRQAGLTPNAALILRVIKAA